MAKLRVIKPASRAGFKVRNLHRRRKALNILVIIFLVEHLAIAYYFGDVLRVALAGGIH